MEHINAELKKIAHLFEDFSQQALGDDGDLYACSICRDSGYLFKDGKAFPCACQAEALLQQRKSKAGLSSRLRQMRFANFDLAHYPEYLRSKEEASYRSWAEKALAAAKQFSQSCQTKLPAKGLLLEGQVGSGKTHLAAAIANDLVEAGLDVLFIVAPEFLDQLRGSYRRENEGLDETEIIRRAYASSVLIIDDLGAHNYTDWVRNKFFTIINHRYNSGLPCVITTNLSLDEMEENIGSRTTSRIIELCPTYRLLVDQDLRFR